MTTYPKESFRRRSARHQRSFGVADPDQVVRDNQGHTAHTPSALSVRYTAKESGRSAASVKKAVKKVGSGRKRVTKALKRK